MDVYAIRDPDSQLYRYVGISVDPQRRLNAHRHSHMPWLPVHRWLRELASHGKHPTLVMLQHTTPHQARQDEYDWICTLIEEGHPLLNQADTPPNKICPRCGFIYHGPRSTRTMAYCCPGERYYWLPGPQMQLFFWPDVSTP